MKKRNLIKLPSVGDFKNKCSEMVRSYDARIIRTIFETTKDSVYWSDSSFSNTVKLDIVAKLQVLFKKQKVSVMHLDKIVSEILTYFGTCFLIIDSGQRRQN